MIWMRLLRRLRCIREMPLTRRKIWLAFTASLLVAVIALAIMLEPYGIARGLFNGESFLEWRPTSYWREVLKREIANGPVSNATKHSFGHGNSSAVFT